MSDETVQAELERLRAENAALRERTTRGVSLRVSEKGGVSVDELRSFIREHEGKLKAKEPRA
jgi:hypothetical protein